MEDVHKKGTEVRKHFLLWCWDGGNKVFLGLMRSRSMGLPAAPLKLSADIFQVFPLRAGRGTQ